MMNGLLTLFMNGLMDEATDLTYPTRYFPVTNLTYSILPMTNFTLLDTAITSFDV